MSEIELIEKLKQIMKDLDIKYLPPIFDMRKLKIVGIERQIIKYGGYKKLSLKYNIPIKKSIRSSNWDIKKAKESIILLMKELNTNTFPTLHEMNNSNFCGLSAFICKNYGVKEFSKNMSLELKECDTWTGHKGEDILESLLIKKGYLVEKQSMNCIYDFLINKSVRVDCKFSNLHTYKKQNGTERSSYDFSLGTKYHDCDLYILLYFDSYEKLKVLIIPQSKLINNCQISISELTPSKKWSMYENRFDLLDKYIEFYNDIDNLV